MIKGELNPEVLDCRWKLGGRRVRGLLILFMGCLALAAPFISGQLALFLVGALLICCGTLEMVETFRAPNESSLTSAYLSGLVSVFVGILLLSSPHVVLRGLAVLLGGSFVLDGASKTVASLKSRTAATNWRWSLAFGLANAALGLMLITKRLSGN
jgi:uncharacterized membrane protein HdeD (DUF308 family)